MLVHVNKTMHKVTDGVASDNINLSTSCRAAVMIQWADIIVKDASVHHGRHPESAVVAVPSREGHLHVCLCSNRSRQTIQRDFDK